MREVKIHELVMKYRKKKDCFMLLTITLDFALIAYSAVGHELALTFATKKPSILVMTYSLHLCQQGYHDSAYKCYVLRISGSVASSSDSFQLDNSISLPLFIQEISNSPRRPSSDWETSASIQISPTNT
ncbi:hypothetical protein RRG08_029715 [Elysia crispata]|uniref:Uncharacterized protein n=1 Tax=Elysia crispata TaxID=231223 RepID=A0AAE1A3J8_9GAST|nr:hypothetical protein RRG08_029715 [Elysia crispata]